MHDPLDRIADARDDFDKAAQRFEQARARQQVVTGRDASGQVSVRVAPDGLLSDVLLEAHWTSRLAAEELGGAVLEAYTAATVASMEEWGRAVVDEVDRDASGEPRHARPLPPTSDSVYAALSELATPETLAQRSEASLNALADLLRGARRDLDRVTEEAEALAARTLVGESQGAKVTLAGTGALLAVEVEATWASSTNPANLAGRIMRAYEDARRQVRARTVEDVVADSSIGELQRLAADPRALAERLGLT